MRHGLIGEMTVFAGEGPMMDFCGRRKEIAAIKKALEHRKNIIITGRFGVGRTTLVQYFAQLKTSPWRFLFADFSQPPAKMCNDLLSQLPQFRGPGGRRNYTTYKTCRNLLSAFRPETPCACVIVMDNIARLTAQKLTFLRHLHWGKRFLFIAIAESFLSDKDLFELRANLLPAEMLILQNLSREESIQFFRYFSDKYRFCWSASRIRALAASKGGYPLLIKEYVVEERKRRNAGAWPRRF